MRKLKFLTLAALVVFPLWACDEDEDTTPTTPVTPTPAVGTVSGTVSVEGTGLANVSVTLSGATSQSATTGSSGGYSFASVTEGNYGVTIADFPADVTFSTTSKTTSIATDGQTATVDFNGSYIRTASIAGQLTSAGVGVEGVTVTATGPEGAESTTSDTGGNYSFTGLRAGSYTVALSNIPTGYIFTITSKDVTLSVGEGEVVSFFGEQEITATVVIKSITTGVTNTPVNPAAVVGQADFTLQINEGTDDVTKVALLLNGTEVASQTFTQASAPEAAGGEFEIIFSINTAAFGATTGTATYPNGVYEVTAQLDTENQGTAAAASSITLTFANVDTFTGSVAATTTAIGANGLLYSGGSQTATILPVVYSGKTVSSVTASYINPTLAGAIAGGTRTDAAAPFSITWSSGAGGPLNGYQTPAADLGAESIQIVAGLYSDGTVFDPTGATLPIVLAANVTTDNVAPTAPVLNLTDQVAGALAGRACCSNNWVSSAYTWSAGQVGASADNANGVGGVVTTYHVGAATATNATIGATTATVTAGDAGMTLDLVNTTRTVVAKFVDALGNTAYSRLAGAGANLLTTFGYDNTDPTAQTVAAGAHPDKIIYNAAGPAPQGGLTFAAAEDRSGFSAVPLRLWISRLNATNLRYSVGVSATSGGAINTGLAVAACAAMPTNAAPCIPNRTIGAANDAYFHVWGATMDQAGNIVDTAVERDMLVDQTIPTQQNVGVPPTMTANTAATFSVPVADNLDLWEVAFAFDFGDTFYVPFGEDVVVGDSDRWDGNLVTTATAVLTLATPVIARETTTAAGVPSNNMALATNVRAITTDAAGNQSGAVANNFIAGTVAGGVVPASFGAAGNTQTTAFRVTAPAAPTTMCNGQGTTACAAANTKSQTFTFTATGASGVFPNPFGTGKIYVYVVIDPNNTWYNGDEVWNLLGSIDATTATITDTGGVRTYTWTYALTSTHIASISAGTANVMFAVIGQNSTNGAVLVGAPSADIAVANGT